MQRGFIAFFGTDDLEATHEFYANLLALTLVIDQGTCRIYRAPGGGFIGFCEHLEVCRAERAPILTFVTDAVDEVYEKLVRSGVKLRRNRGLTRNTGYTIASQKIPKDIPWRSNVSKGIRTRGILSVEPETVRSSTRPV